MNKIVCSLAVLFLLMQCFGTPVLAAEPQDVSSLFYLQGKMPAILPFILVYMTAFSLSALFLANAYFSWQKTARIIELMEAFIVDKLYREEETSLISNVDQKEFRSGLLESELILGEKVVHHRGVYLLKCNPADKIELAVIHLMENIVGKWNRSVLYMGRNRQGILEGLKEDEQIQEREFNNFKKYLSPYLYFLPAICPNPDKILKAARKLKQNSDLGAVVIEDLNCINDIREFTGKSELKQMAEISLSLRLPVFIVCPEGSSCDTVDSSSIMERHFKLFSAGEIRIDRGRETYIF